MTKEHNKEGHSKKTEDSKKKESEMERMTQEINDLTDTLKRVQAEFDNYKKRTSLEKEAYGKVAKAQLFEKLIPIIDHFENALKHAAENDNFVMGMRMIHGLLLDLLQSEHVSILDPLDQKFDPHKHEAIGTMTDASKEGDVVLEVQQKGYMLFDKVIRQAKVVVNVTRPEGTGSEKEQTQNEKENENKSEDN
ncbi:MAG: nucleotide exchange factor GrpE [Candidatus Woesearchaeota archaeon]